MGDNCAFCLAALGGGAGALVLPCGHAFHSTCALQFLLKRKQCIVCRAPVDETRVMDVSQLPPEAAGRQFVPPPSPPGQQGSGDKKSGGGSDAGGGAPHIELQAFAGSSAAAAAGSAAGQPAVPATPGADYLPDYLGPSPRAAGPAGPAPFVAVQVDGTPPPPLACQPPQPLRTITVVRPQHWARRLLLFGMLLTLLAVITAIPIILARRGGGDDDRWEASKEACEECFQKSFFCPLACDAYLPAWLNN